MSRLRSLGQKIADREDELLARPLGDEALRQELARRAADRPLRLARRRRQRALFAATSVLMLAGAVIAGVRLSSPSSLTFTIGEPVRPGLLGEWVSASPDLEAPIRFSDGTRLALAPGARGRVVSAGAHGAEIVIESGSASVHVVPDDRGDFRIRTGPFLVRVHGTRFTVSWEPSRDEFRLALHEGSVTVSGCSLGAGRTVDAGETVRASCAAPAAAPTERDAGARLVAPPASSAWPPPPPRSTDRVIERPAAEAPSWMALAREGLYDDAFRSAQRAGFTEVQRSRSSGDVLLLADVARHSGHLELARASYEAVRERFPGSDAAAAAAFALGRLAFDGSHDFGGAAKWLEAYLAERPAGPLSMAAMGRLLEARIALGDRASARAIAQRYLALHPGGPLANEARKIIDARD